MLENLSVKIPVVGIELLGYHIESLHAARLRRVGQRDQAEAEVHFWGDKLAEMWSKNIHHSLIHAQWTEQDLRAGPTLRRRSLVIAGHRFELSPDESSQ